MGALRIWLAVVVSIVWTATFGKYLWVGGESPPPELSAIMLAVVTWVMGAEIKDAVKNRK